GYVDETGAQSGSDRDAPRVACRVELEREGVRRLASAIGFAAERVHDGLAAVVAEAQLAEDVQGRRVVAQVRTAEACRLKAAAIEDVRGASDRLALLCLIQAAVIAVHESVERELHPLRRVPPQEIGVPCQHARGRLPRRPDPE